MFSPLRFVDLANGGADATADVLALLRARCPELFALPGGGEGARYAVAVELFPSPAGSGGPRAMAAKFGVPYLGTLPLDPELGAACERGAALRASPRAARAAGAAAPLQALIDAVIRSAESAPPVPPTAPPAAAP